MNLNKKVILTVAVTIFTSTAGLAAELFHAELWNLHENNIGYIGNLINGTGYMRNAPVLYVRFNREVSKLSNNQYKISISYPAAVLSGKIPENVQLPQTGMSFACALRPRAAELGLRLARVNMQAKWFWDFHKGPPPIQSNATDNALQVCNVIVRTSRPLEANQLQALGALTTTGLPDLAARQDVVVRKAYSAIAPPYIQFLKSSNVSFRTDDEFWFLISASVHYDSTLAADFAGGNLSDVENWVGQFVLYVVNQVGDKDLFGYVQTMLPPGVSSVKQNYEYVNVTDERIYEL